MDEVKEHENKGAHRKEKHNGIVSLWKFIFSLVIVIFHVHQFHESGVNPFFSAGYIAVEFFFIVAGFYFAKSIIENTNSTENIGKEDMLMIIKKIKSIFIFIFVAFVLNLVIKIFSQVNWTTDKWVNSIWNLLLLQNFGFGNIRIMGELWYLSVMLLVMYVTYPFIKKYKENFILLASPVIIILTLGYIGHFIGHLDVSFRPWGNYISLGILRGLGEMCIGYLLYTTSQFLKKVDYTVLGKTVLTIMQHMLLIIVLLVITFIENASRYDFVMLLMISISVLIMTSKKTYDYKILSNKFINFLGQLSLPIFVNHTAFICLLDLLLDFNSLHEKAIVTVFITIIFSTIEMKIINAFRKTNIKKRICNLVVK